MELYVQLTNKCNFACAHCISSCGKNVDANLISKAEIESLSKLINNELKIKCVHFIGGEPTLEVEIIKLFQALVTRKVQYSITTNGSFADADSFFDQIRIDDLTLSYDKFHAPFISIEVLKNVIRTAIKRGIKVSIRSTYKRIDDLNIVKPLLGDKNVTVLPAALIHGGRYFESSGVDYSCNPFNEPCPSSINSSLKRHRVTYYPSKGFSPCCGPLLFSSNVKEILYGDTLETSAFHGLVNEKFDNLFRKYGLRPCNEHQYSTVCDACVSLFGAIDHRNSPSLRAIVRDVRTYILPLSGPVDDASLFALAHRYDAKILYFADAMIRDRLSLEPMLASSIVSSVDLDSSSCDEIAELYNRVFFDPFSEYLRGSTLNTKDGFRSAVKDYHSVLYRKNNKLVGALLLQYRERYSYAPEKAGWHVGFVGYDKAMVTLSEARAIKANIISVLCDLFSNAHPQLSVMTGHGLTTVHIGAAIDYFNASSMKFFTKLGFKPYLLYLEPRNAAADGA